MVDDDEIAAAARVADAMAGAMPVPVPVVDPIEAAFARGLRGCMAGGET